MSVNVNDITITSLETIAAFDIVSGAFKWVLDELQNATIANTQETTDITGKQGRLLNTLKRNKAVTVSGNNGVITVGDISERYDTDGNEIYFDAALIANKLTLNGTTNISIGIFPTVFA